MPGSGSTEILRILLVSSQEEIQKQVTAALAGRARDYRLFWVSQPDIAALRAEGLQPRVILLDDELAGVDPVSLIPRLRTAAPEAAIIMLVPQGGMSTAGKAVLAGAGAFVTRPVHAAELLPTLGQALGSTRQAAKLADGAVSRGRIIVFCSPEAGAGRTTMAVNLALSLARAADESVVVVDADFADPAVHVALSLQPDHTAADLLTRTGRLDQKLIEGALVRHASGVAALLAPRAEAGQKPFSRSQTQALARGLKQMFAWTLVDLGAPMDDMAYAWVDAADLVTLPVLPEVAGLRGARQMLDQLYARGYLFAKVPVILNRAGLPDGMALEEVQYWLGVRVDRQIPDDQNLAARTVSHGVPAVINNEYPEVLGAYDAWAKDLLDERGALAVPFAAAAAAMAPVAPPVEPWQPQSERRRRADESRLSRLLLYGSMGVLLALLAASAVLFITLGRDRGRLARGRAVTAILSPQPVAAGGGVTPSPQPSPTEEEAAPSFQPSPTEERATPSPQPVAAVEAMISSPTPTDRQTGVGAAAGGEATPSPTVVSVTPSPSPQPSPMVVSATPLPSSQPSPTVASATPSPSAQPSPTAAVVTPTPRPSPRPSPTRAATRRPAPTPQPTVAPAAVAVPSVASPARGEARSGAVTFSWQPTGPLPSGAAYEVVWWNEGEDPATARGIAAPTTDSTLTANLDVLYNASQFRSNNIHWAVLVVNESPYQRLASPGPANSSMLVYSPSTDGGGGGGAPPPPRP